MWYNVVTNKLHATLRDNDNGDEDLNFDYNPTCWQEQGLTQTATGYGSKLSQPYTIKYKGRTRRLYCRCYSNIGTHYIIVNKKQVIIS